MCAAFYYYDYNYNGPIEIIKTVIKIREGTHEIEVNQQKNALRES